MSTWSQPSLEPLCARLGPYARSSFERAAELAARLHADEISPEHWLASLLADEECAATRAVLHAFADPETIGVEVLALCAGIMVVGSARTLPFSVRAVEALREARARAAARPTATVEPADVLHSAVTRLPPELRERLGLLAPPAREDPGQGPGVGSIPTAGPLFRNYSSGALQALGASARAAASFSRPAISPAHLVLGALEVDDELRTSTGLTPGRMRLLLHGLDEDRTPLPERRLAADERLGAMLAELPQGAETLEILGWLLARGGEEVNGLLRRQRVTMALFERCRGVYLDP